MPNASSPRTPEAQPTVVVNGRAVYVDTRGTDIHHTAVSQWLRSGALTGTKQGCAEGDCGACTVLLQDTDARGAPCWRSMTSCITPLALVLGRELVTVEGVSRDPASLHPVQAAMVKHHGSQCGYCTPGFICTMAETYEREDIPAPAGRESSTHSSAAGRGICAATSGADGARLNDALAGNLCRCTGYRPIRDAMVEALCARDGAPHALVGIGTTARRPCAASPAQPALHVPFVDNVQEPALFLRPSTQDELLQLRAQHPDAQLVAGATELGVLLRKRAARFATLISTEGVAALRTVQDTGTAFVIGGAATLTQVEEAVGAQIPALQRVLRTFASRQIRNRATVAGNIVTASPIGDLAPLLLALSASVTLASVRGARTLPLESFFLGYRKTALLADEVVTAITVPKPAPSARVASAKVSKRVDLDISCVSAGFSAHFDSDGTVRDVRIALGGVAATPVRVPTAEAALRGHTLAAGCAAACAALHTALAPIDDVRGTAAYRRAVAAALLERFCVGDADATDGDVTAPHLQEGFEPAPPHDPPAASRALAHDSARGHVTGAALYVDDAAQRRVMLDVWPVLSTVAHGTLQHIDTAKARLMPGVHAVLTAADIPGMNDVGAVRHDEPLLAAGTVAFMGQPLALVVADTVAQARAAAAAVEVRIAPLPPILTIADAVAQSSFHTAPHVIAQGDVDAAIAAAPHSLAFALHIGGQEHFYLETHAATAELDENGDVHVTSSTQHPSEIQTVVAHVLNKSRHNVVVTAPRMGGGFGGKETQGNTLAALVALAAHKTGRPVRAQLDRDVDMEMTGKRHPFHAQVRVGFSDSGKVLGLDVSLVSNGGFALDLSEAILDRALFHLDNAYHFPAVRLTGRVAKTNVQSHTAFRGFGGPQGMLVVEDTLSRVAQFLGVTSEEVRERNFYARRSTTQQAPYGQVVSDFRIADMWPRLKESAQLDKRRAQTAHFNATHSATKRGIAMVPVKFGISFTTSFLNQAGALVLLYRDGTAQVNHGGTEMGQGLHTKVCGIVMRDLGLPQHRIRIMPTATDKVPNTSATAASSGADLNGAAVRAACVELRERLLTVASALLDRPAADLTLADGHVWVTSSPAQQLTIAHVCEQAYLRQVPLFAAGHYRTPDIAYDKAAGRGKPFHYYAYGVACSEVEVDATTGMKRVLRVDILHDTGTSLHPAIDRGQIEGGFIQGMGWLTAEELLWSGADAKSPGRLLTHSASTVQIPTITDVPPVFHVELFEDAFPQDASESSVVHGSKAVGEPPLMLALSVREALRCAVAAFGAPGSRAPAERVVALDSPLTHEALFWAIGAQKGAS